VHSTCEKPIVRLSSSTNAHAEVPEGTAYSLKVCYGNLVCTSAEGAYSDIELVSLSADTNAHIGSFNSYNDTKIRCASPTMISAFWSEGGYTPTSHTAVVPDATEIYTVVRNTEPSTTVRFEIYEKDTVSDDFIKSITATVDENGKAVGNWPITQQNLIEGGNEGGGSIFYFEVYDQQTGGNLITTSGDLTISLLDSNFCDDKAICGDYSDKSSCENYNVCGSRIAENSVSSNVDCSDPLVNCYCKYNSTTCVGKFDAVGYVSGVEEPTGSCVITQGETIGSCSEGDNSISYPYTASWNGGGESPENDCEDGEQVVACPALIQLPFFGFYNFIITAIVIALIYAVFASRKKR
jgi:hypothetical protein